MHAVPPAHLLGPLGRQLTDTLVEASFADPLGQVGMARAVG